MKKFHKSLVVTGLVVCMALGMTGCKGKVLDGSQIAATVGTKEMTLGEANFFLRFQQVQTESYYESLLGEGIYGRDLYGNGTTYGDTLKSDIMSQMQEYYILEEKAAEYGVTVSDEEKAAITEAAAKFLEANDEDAKEQMTADQETVERILTLMTIRSKVVNAIYDTADVTVTEEEAAQRGFVYITVSKGSGDDALTEEEIAESKDKLAAAAQAVAGGDSMEGAATAQGLTASNGTYGNGTGTNYATELITALDGLKEGEVSEVIETETALYLAQVTTDLDKEATVSRMQTLLLNKKAEYYSELLEGWKEEYPLSVNDSVWDQVIFNRSYALKSAE